MKVKVTKKVGKKETTLVLNYSIDGHRKQQKTGLALVGGNDKESKALNRMILKKAEQMALELELQLKEGAVVKKVPTVMEYFKKVLDRRKTVAKVEYNTVKSWLITEKKLQEYLHSISKEGLSIADWNKSLSEDFGLWLSKDLKATTVNLYLTKLHMVLTTAVEDEFLHLKDAKVEKIKEQRQSVVFLTENELQRLHDTPLPQYPYVRLGALLSAVTGLRISDLSKLEWSMVKKDGIHLTTQKTKKPMIIPVVGKVKALLAECKKLPASNLYGTNHILGDLRNVSYNYVFAQWQTKAGIQTHLRWHRFRDTFANLLITKGIDIFTVSKLLTHSSVTTTQKSYVTDANKDKMAQAIAVL